MARFKVVFELDMDTDENGQTDMNYVAAAAADLMMNESLEFAIVTDDGIKYDNFNTENYA